MSIQSQLASFSMTVNQNGRLILSTNSQSSFVINDFNEQPELPLGGIGSFNGNNEMYSFQPDLDINNSIPFGTGIINNNNNTTFVNNNFSSNQVNCINNVFVNNNYGGNIRNMNYNGGFQQFSGKAENHHSFVANPGQQAMSNNNCNDNSLVLLRDSEAEDEFHVNNEASVGSVGSTVQETADTGAGANSEASDEPLAYLGGLNSGNLMQFSQQSMLREMMLQEIKSQNTLPKLEDHNNGGYEFSMVLEEPRKSHWLYSQSLNKLYIRMNKTFNVDVQFKAKLPIQPLNLRVFLCFLKDVSGPVLRCQNHISTEPLLYNNVKIRENILRCENPNTVYCGTAQGKGISERYSVLVPLNMSRSSNRSYMRQTLAFKFACQNSCFGRKETSLIFCLENACGDILGQQVLEVKICTCPKRDRNAEERQVNDKKRKSAISNGASDDDDDEDCDNDNDSVDAKRQKRCRRSESYQRDVKQEEDSTDSGSIDQSLPTDWQVKRTSKGEYQLVFTCPKKELLMASIESMFQNTAAAILRSPTKVSHLHQHAANLTKLKESASKLP